ncbi:MAG: radical SAM protein [Desulfobulbus sp.]|jgi:wyosine [tRNA(Phe)-imidazoG37] synthetase (radical SAM superfamily)|uniref:radical SAM protein n=1 Tax=Desulfobulbus sp. TaxID=895 RepID=UPI002846997E|nr:radical SAM protein [Desulfobulbus sp.]MDR2549727.1 radical SAM protein [Desulfobulbus sp.]
MDYIFGPVQSRRLGRSLGIDLFPRKICNLNCVYCEVGPTCSPVTRRAAYSPVRLICEEIDEWCADPGRLAAADVLTVTAKGEPTLHSGLGEILEHLKARAAKPVAVLTNGTTLADAEVRRDLMAADLVVPSLDAARDEGFARVDRPADSLELGAVIDGLILFSRDFPGKVWLEILLVQGMNDAPEDIAALVAVLGRMRIDRIQLNTVMRPPAEAWAHPLSRARLTAIAQHVRRELGLPVDLPFADPDERTAEPVPAAMTDPAMLAAIRDDILHMVQRRPCTAIDIDRTFHLGGPEKVVQLLDPLIRAGDLFRQAHGDSWYYQRASCEQETDSGLPGGEARTETLRKN